MDPHIISIHPARNSWIIAFSDGTARYFRTAVTSASEAPILPDEALIAKLCELLAGKPTLEVGG